MTVIAARQNPNRMVVACDSQVTIGSSNKIYAGPKWYFNGGNRYTTPTDVPPEAAAPQEPGLIGFAVGDGAIDTFLGTQRGLWPNIPRPEELQAEYITLVNWVTNAFLPQARAALLEEYPDDVEDVYDACELLVVTAEEMVYCPNLRTTIVPDVPYYAIGTGADAAMGALFMGAIPSQAVHAAQSRDIHCGGQVHVVSFERDNPVELLGVTL